MKRCGKLYDSILNDNKEARLENIDVIYLGHSDFTKTSEIIMNTMKEKGIPIVKTKTKTTHDAFHFMGIEYRKLNE